MTATTLIGDLIGSRGSADRRRLHRTFADVLDRVNTELCPPTPVRMQVGDEYQGVFASLGDALHASLLVRLALLPDADVRHGIGRGPVEVLSEDPRVEDGPGWWAARAAIERVEEAEGRPGERSLRTAYVATSDPAGRDEAVVAQEAAVNAALVLRDHLVSGLSPRSVSVLRGLLDGASQRDLAEALGISPSAVSQRVRGDGLGAIIAAHELTRGMP
ncbi:SatD family protein [Nocardioides sediminis]|uniref:SatD family protein n=1 Tax=Nocardioides sediminis TaxID=433648 RepID=UPI000D3265E9|nr:SatD family protein [Nocardioides sediminis]